MRKLITSCVAALLTLTGCASRPTDISPNGVIAFPAYIEEATPEYVLFITPDGHRLIATEAQVFMLTREEERH